MTLHNDKTGNSVTVATDAGRDDAFVLAKLQYSGGYVQEPETEFA